MGGRAPSSHTAPESKRKYTPTNPSSRCGKGVTARSRAVSCDSCGQWTHNRCANVFSKETYDELCNSGDQCNVMCQRCSFYPLPFTNDTTDDLLSDIPEMDVLRMALTSNLTNLTVFCFLRKGLHFIHLNARSLLPKLDELNVLASKTKAAVIDVSETRLDDSVEDSEVELPGYSILRHDRNRNGGGVCIYLRSDLAFNPRQDLQSDGVESVWAEVLPKTRPILTGHRDNVIFTNC